ncbi:hypothetical protein FNV43_RR26881 [Rhamnella rubrinervis]|uniref:Dynein light chain n=1 Tax=Rhamnella rubrinervis TaxID=2594499 RepID=A0A8K0DVS7_9ROSA|nr:hypothetical protein FNV43_RR26881 [Rhamnella rubrinervis]
MEGAEEELERRSKFLSSLIQKKKAVEQQENYDRLNVRVRASDMPIPLQNQAFRCARDHLDSMPGKLDSKRLALALKKVYSFFSFKISYSLALVL